MRLRELSEETIRTLSDLATLLCDVDIHTPTQGQMAKDKEDIEAVLPPAEPRSVREPYAMLVSIAYEYARIHYRDEKHSLLSDIADGKKIKDINISDYKFKLEEI